MTACFPFHRAPLRQGARCPAAGSVWRPWFAALLALAVGGALADADPLAKARAAFDTGDLPTAVVLLKDRLQADPGDGAARLLLGRIALESGDGVGAAQEAERVLAANATDGEALALLAEALLAQGRHADLLARVQVPTGATPAEAARLLALRGEAELGREDIDAARVLFGQAMALDAGSLEAAIGAGLMLAAGGDLDAAREALTALTEQHPESARAWRTLGNFEFVAGQPAAAVAAFTQAIERSRVDWPVIFQRGLARTAANDLDGARADRQLLEEQAPQHPGLDYLRGWVLLREGRAVDAAAALESWLRVAPDDPRGLYFAALAHYQAGQQVQAAEHLTRLRARAPEQPLIATLLAMTHLARQDGAAAVAVLEPLRDDRQAPMETLEVLRRALVAVGRQQDAAALLEEMVARWPGRDDAALLLAEQQLLAGRTADAVALLRRVVAPRPEPGPAEGQVPGQEQHREQIDGAANRLLVRGLLELGDTDGALAVADALLARGKQMALAHTLRAAVRATRGDTEGARADFQAALGVEPAFSQAALGLAALELGSAQGEAARETLNELLAADPASTLGWLALAGLDAREGGPAAAVERLRAALARNPTDLSLRLATVRTLLQQREPAPALAVLGQTPTEQADRPLVLLLRAQAEYDAGQTDAAYATLSRFAERNPRSAQARFLMGVLLARASNLQAAEAQFVEGLRLDQSQALPAEHLEALLAPLPDDAARVAVLERLLREAPEHPLLRERRARLALAMGNPADALARFDAVRREHPERREAVLGFADALAAAGRPGEARVVLGEWLTGHPTDGPGLLARAQVALAQGDTAQAVADYRALLDQGGEHPVALNNLAMLTLEQDPAAALPLAERGVALRPDDPLYLDTLGLVLLALNQPARAGEVLGQAHAKTTDPSVAYHYAQALAALGDAVRARTVLVDLQGREFPERAAAEALLQSLRQE